MTPRNQIQPQTGQCGLGKSDGPAQPAALGRRAEVRRVLLEGVLVAMIGAAFALAVNEVSPRGLSLTRDYFPGAIRSLPATASATNRTSGAGQTNAHATSSMDLLSARLKTKGLLLVGSNQVTQFFRNPRYEQELVIFIDARDDRHYQEGHVPGAFQFDPYRAENYALAVLPVCQTAEQIVVYCHGGDCEDSEFAATILGDAGVSKAKLFVYGGGLTEWMTNGLPVEVGLRKSGNVRSANK